MLPAEALRSAQPLSELAKFSSSSILLPCPTRAGMNQGAAVRDNQMFFPAQWYLTINMFSHRHSIDRLCKDASITFITQFCAP